MSNIQLEGLRQEKKESSCRAVHPRTKEFWLFIPNSQEYRSEWTERLVDKKKEQRKEWARILQNSAEISLCKRKEKTPKQRKLVQELSRARGRT